MPSIYLQEKLSPEEVFAIKEEFPHYDLLFECKTPSEWNGIEILYGRYLTLEELENAPRLKWIHCPTADIDGLCINEIEKQGDILLSLSTGQNVPQIAEFVIGGILAFAKQFFHWPEARQEPAEFWDWPLKETMWTMQKKTLLQVGLGEVGSTIVKMGNSLGMKSWGVQRERSFHPECHKTFPLSNLHSLLPVTDVVVSALPKRLDPEVIFGEREFELMKNDSIFILVGSADQIDEDALARVGKRGKFRGVLLDAFSHPPPSKNSPLWQIPNVILTPSVATYPKSKEHLSFSHFRQNLRFFVPGKINEMKKLVLT